MVQGLGGQGAPAWADAARTARWSLAAPDATATALTPLRLATTVAPTLPPLRLAIPAATHLPTAVPAPPALDRLSLTPIARPAPRPAPQPAPPAPTVAAGPSGVAWVLELPRHALEGLGLLRPERQLTPQEAAGWEAYTKAQGTRKEASPSLFGPGKLDWNRLSAVFDTRLSPITARFHSPAAAVTPAKLKELGRTDKQAFFAALRPAAEAAARRWGIPVAVTLAQAALESGWGESAIAGYNLFGIKGKGSQGSARLKTKEFERGRYVTITDAFAAYGSYDEAFNAHGRLFHNGYYDKAVRNYGTYKDPYRFVRDIQGIYATSPTYARDISKIMRDYKLA